MKLTLPKKELTYLGIAFLLSILSIKLVFYHESFINIFKLVFGLFWVLILPGHVLMLYFREKFPFHLRLMVGTALAAVIIGAISYYLGLLGLNLKYHIYFLPVVFILIGGCIYLKNEQGRIQ